jgi:hypothetical protein
MELKKGKKYIAFIPSCHKNGIVDELNKKRTKEMMEGIVKFTGIVLVGWFHATALTQFQFFEVK